MSLVITGATGHLGRLVIEDLLAQGVPAAGIVAAGRDVTKVKDLADRGVVVRAVNYDDPATLDGVFAPGDRVLLISGSEVGQRVRQHGAVIDAAQRAGVALLAYTSIANAGTATMRLAQEHQATEQAILASGLPYALLRNSWYLEIYTDQIPGYLQHGAVVGSAGDGRNSAASRADYAAAAAAVLTRPDVPAPGRAYELGGDHAFTLAGLAAEISAQAGREIPYRDLPVEQYAQVLEGAGLPPEYAAIIADADLGLARGELQVAGTDLRQLTGRPAVTLREAVAAALAKAG
ncbi:MAG TPA: SDR family oxidoreductase [Trebonia sp.]|jgi:NAD(P)H dehydrogenase (quinone)|nr:SDR family oxidoreductase [Trebonia sp.]